MDIGEGVSRLNVYLNDYFFRRTQFIIYFKLLEYFLQITYSVPYALISSRIESLGLGQGEHFFSGCQCVLKVLIGVLVLGLLMLMLGSCRLINGCTESGNCNTTGMAALFRSSNECACVRSETK